MSSRVELLQEIERVLPEGGDWCDLDKAETLAALILATRPAIVCELGIWIGGSAIPMALALKHNGRGRLYAVDPWSTAASIEGQSGANAEWWATVDHEEAYRRFLERIGMHSLSNVTVMRMTSDEAPIVTPIDILHIDSNHGPQAIKDVLRWAPNVVVGGFLVLDDLGWEGQNVERARDEALGLGFIELYHLGTGALYQRVRLPK